MTQKTLSVWLRIVALFAGAAGLSIFILVLPGAIANYLVLLPGTGWFAVMARGVCYGLCLPFAAAIVEFYLICRRIGQNRSFTAANARSLRAIGFLSMADTALVFVLLIGLVAAQALDALFVLAVVLLMLVGVLVTVAAFTLSHLVLKAWQIKEENELTI